MPAVWCSCRRSACSVCMPPQEKQSAGQLAASRSRGYSDTQSRQSMSPPPIAAVHQDSRSRLARVHATPRLLAHRPVLQRRLHVVEERRVVVCGGYHELIQEIRDDHIPHVGHRGQYSALRNRSRGKQCMMHCQYQLPACSMGAACTHAEAATRPHAAWLLKRPSAPQTMCCTVPRLASVCGPGSCLLR